MYETASKTCFYFLLLLLATFFCPANASVDGESIQDLGWEGLKVGSCSSNSKISSWCDSSMNDVECMMDVGRNVYVCQCPADPSACPDECIPVQEAETKPIKTRHSILCHGVIEDEPNYILKSKVNLPVHHCENNGIVANWCNEATNPEVDCLLLPALDEYVCTCRENAAFCPTECIEGSSLGRKTKHAVRCRGIPIDSPNYILE